MRCFIGYRSIAVVLMLGGLAACATPAPTVTLAPSPTLAPRPTPAPSATPAPRPTPAPSPTPTPMPGVLYVDAGQSLGPISPLVYGSNYGPWMGAFLPDVQRQAEQSGITYLRFPGGDWGDQNDLTGEQIDAFIAFCRRLEAEPSISVRLRGGTPAQAAELLRYANQTKKYGVRYWSIGNEPSLYGDYDIARYNREWRAIALALRAVDPSIKLIGPDIHQLDPQGGPRDPGGRFSMSEYLDAFLRANGDLVDIVAIHRYAFPRQPSDPDPSIADLRANSSEWDTIIPNLRAQIRASTDRDLPVAVTELNSNWTPTFGGEATPDSIYGAIWWADVLGRLIRQRVAIVAQFALYAPESAGWGLLRAYSTRPAYYVYRMYQHFGGELLYATSDDPQVSIYAARRADGALTILLINLGSEPQTKPLRLAGISINGSAETWLLDQQHNAEQIDPTPLDANASVLLPPASATLLIVSP